MIGRHRRSPSSSSATSSAGCTTDDRVALARRRGSAHLRARPRRGGRSPSRIYIALVGLDPRRGHHRPRRACRCYQAALASENYRAGLDRGQRAGDGPPVWLHAPEQPGDGAASSPSGKIAISIISAYAVVFFRFPVRMFFFWMIFVTLMLPVEVRIIPTFKVVVRPRPDQHLRRPHRPARSPRPPRTFAVPPVLPDRPRRAGRGRQDRRRRAAALLLGHPAARCRGPTSRRSSSSCSSSAGTSTSGRCSSPPAASMDTIVIGITQDDRHRRCADRVEPRSWPTAMLAMLPPVAVVRLHAALVREGPGGDREVRGALVLAGLALGGLAAARRSAAAQSAPSRRPSSPRHRGGAPSGRRTASSPSAMPPSRSLDSLEFDVHLSQGRRGGA